jgi:hypothetical protein
VITDVGFDGCFAGHWRRLRNQGFLSEEPIYFAGVIGGKVFAAWIGPEIIDSTGDVERARGEAREEHVLVDRQILFIARELRRVAA